MSDYEAGKIWLQVTPSFRGVQTLISAEAFKLGKNARKDFDRGFDQGGTKVDLGPSRPESQKQGAAAGGAFADGFRRRVEAAMRALPPAKLKADATDAERTLRDLRLELEELANKTVGVDIDTGTAMAQLERIDEQLEELNRESADVQVRADTMQARAQLAAIHAQVNDLDRDDVNIDVDVDSFGRGIGSIDTFSGRLVLLATAGAALAPAIVPAAGAAAVALMGIGAAATVGLAGIGALVIGFTGITDAVQAMGDAQRSAAEDAEDASKRQASAARQMESAERGLANARANAADAAESAERRVANAREAAGDAAEDAARAVATAVRRQQDAERSLAAAQRTTAQAQLDLTRAREDAQDALDDLALATRGAALAEEDAELGLARARENLAIQVAEGVGGIDLSEAELAVRQAELRLDQARDRNQEVQEEAAAATAAGVDGARAVLDAEQRLADARSREISAATSLRDAELAVVQARVDGAERVADAQERVSEALRAQESQQRTSAFAIAGAIAAVEGAQVAVEDAATRTSPAVDKLEESMSALGPAGQAFATFLFGLKDSWMELKSATEAALFPGLQAGIEALMPVLPQFTGFMAGIGGALGTIAEEAGAALAGPEWASFFGYLNDAGPGMLVDLASAVGDIALGIGNLMVAFAPLTDIFIEGLGNMAESFAEWSKGLEDNEGFQTFLDYIVDTLPAVTDFFGALGGAVANLFRSMAPLGPIVLGIATALADLIAAVPPGVLAAIVLAFIGLSTAISVVGTVMSVIALGPAILIVGALVAVGAALVAAYTHSETFRNIVDGALRAVGAAATWLWDKAIQPAFEGIGKIISAIWSGVVEPVFKAYVRYLTEIVAPAVMFLWNEVIKPAFEGMGQAISFVWNDVIKPVFKALGNFIEDTVAPAFQRGVDMIGSIWDTLKDLAKAPVKFIVDTVINDGIIGSFNWIAGKVPGLDSIDPVRIPGFAFGGIYPGYTPGRDIGYAALSGGEAVMRPEWTRVMGASRIDAMNAAARSGGTAGVRNYLGGFALGGIVGDGLGWVKDRAGDLIGGLTSAALAGIRKAVEAAFAPLRQMLDGLGGGLFADIATAPPRAAMDGIEALLYDSGGHLAPGLSLVMNATGVPERVLNPQQESAIEAVLRGRLEGEGGETNLIFQDAGGMDPGAVFRVFTWGRARRH